MKRKPLSELYVDGMITEDRDEWREELQRHCEEVFADHEETRRVQEKRIDCLRKNGDRHFTDDGRRVEIPIDLVLQARAKMSENKVNGPADAVVSEMTNSCHKREIFTSSRSAFKNAS